MMRQDALFGKIHGRRLSLLAGLILLTAAALPAREAGSTRDRANRDSAANRAADQKSAASENSASEKIVIKFADKSLPTIRATGARLSQPYGVSATPEAQAAADQAALDAPPPDLEAFRLEWQDQQMYDTARIQAVASDSFGYGYGDPAQILATPGNGIGNGDSRRTAGTDLFDPLKPIDTRVLDPTPALRYPAYNLSEYLAERAEWQRARERALAHLSRADSERRDPPNTTGHHPKSNASATHPSSAHSSADRPAPLSAPKQKAPSGPDELARKE